jgi:hypothetical protein
MELAVVYNKKTIQFRKSIEISKDMVLILQIYRIYEKKE